MNNASSSQLVVFSGERPSLSVNDSVATDVGSGLNHLFMNFKIHEEEAKMMNDGVPGICPLPRSLRSI
jgi:hypothetical protein